MLGVKKMSELVEATIITETKRYFACPNGCAYKHSIDHLFEPTYVGREVGSWNCKVCGDAYYFTAHSDGRLFVRKCEKEEKYRRAFVVLEIPPQKHPIRLLLDTHAWDGEDDNQRYLYEEHTCPTNWTRNISKIIIDGDEDPHGFAKFVCIYRTDTSEFEVLKEVCDASDNANYPEGWEKLVTVGIGPEDEGIQVRVKDEAKRLT